MSNERQKLTVIKEAKEILDEYGCIPKELLCEIMSDAGCGDLDVKDVMKRIRIMTGVEYTACNDDFVPCQNGGGPVTLWAHPSRVEDKPRRVSWLQSLANAWQRKADMFKEQME